MIYFKPIPDKINHSEIHFEAIENDAVCGKCTLLLNGQNAKVNFLIYEKDKPYIVEGLLKSAFNYAALNNCYMGYCDCANISVFLDKMNFNFENGIYFNDIPSILQGNCCKCKDNI